MAGKTKASKQAKMGHRKGGGQDQGTTVAPTIVSGGHLVLRQIDLMTACGGRRVGWSFGTPESVTCSECLPYVLAPGLMKEATA